jgi:hypothetical protein
MTYYSDEEDQDQEQEISQIEQENEFDRKWDKTTLILEQMKNEIDNPYILMYCDIGELMNFLETGEPPKYDYNQTPYRFFEDNIGYITGPLDMGDCESLDTSKDLREAVKNKIKEEKDEENKKQELIELKKKVEANKHNWTIPKELRGIKPKVELSKSAKRRNRKKRKISS